MMDFDADIARQFATRDWIRSTLRWDRTRAIWRRHVSATRWKRWRARPLAVVIPFPVGGRRGTC